MVPRTLFEAYTKAHKFVNSEKQMKTNKGKSVETQGEQRIRLEEKRVSL